MASCDTLGEPGTSFWEGYASGCGWNRCSFAWGWSRERLASAEIFIIRPGENLWEQAAHVMLKRPQLTEYAIFLKSPQFYPNYKCHLIYMYVWLWQFHTNGMWWCVLVVIGSLHGYWGQSVKQGHYSMRHCAPEAGIKDRDEWLHPTYTVRCNYLSLPSTPDSGTLGHTVQSHVDIT